MLEKLAAYKLLKGVAEADWKAAAKMANANPQLMFEQVISKDFRDDKGLKCKQMISPLKYAVRVCDIYMLDIFEEIIRKRCPAAIIRFEQQMKEQQSDRLDLKPLFDSYQQQTLNPAQLNRMSDLDWNNLVILMGGLQVTHLPMHIIREWCLEGETWHTNPKFDLSSPPADDCRTSHYLNGSPISPLAFKKCRDECYLLLRGQDNYARVCLTKDTSFIKRIAKIMTLVPLFDENTDAGDLLVDFISLKNLWQARTAQMDARLAKCAAPTSDTSVTIEEIYDEDDIEMKEEVLVKAEQDETIVTIDESIFPRVPTHPLPRQIVLSDDESDASQDEPIAQQKQSLFS